MAAAQVIQFFMGSEISVACYWFQFRDFVFALLDVVAAFFEAGPYQKMQLHKEESKSTCVIGGALVLVSAVA